MTEGVEEKRNVGRMTRDEKQHVDEWICGYGDGGI
jgi:hypothetical protein